MKVMISGACGRMGHVVADACKDAGIEVVCGIDPVQGDVAFTLYHSFDDVKETADILIDFSRADSLDSVLAFVTGKKLPAVLATTGYTDAQLDQIAEAAKQIPIFRSYNMSLGMALLKSLCRQAAKTLGYDYDIEIVEAHHNKKIDAPSGSAVLLYDAMKDARGELSPAKNGREGKCPRQGNEIGIHAVRGGTIVGEHDVYFLGANERIRLTHSAESRSLFGTGAVRAAQWLFGKEPGLYGMDDLVK